MSLPWRAAAAALESATALCATLNLAYFLHRTASPLDETYSRRVAAFVLAVVSLGAVAESMLVLASLASSDPAVFGSAPWVLVSAVTFAGMACMSALVLRRIADE